MIFKLIILAAVIYGIYILFFREGNLIEKMKQNRKKDRSDRDKGGDIDTVVECSKCGIYVSIDEAVIKDGVYFCSKECAEIK